MTKLAGTSLEGGEEKIRPRIIGLAGKMGSGKDTAGEILKKYGYSRTAFADGVRIEAAKAFPELEDEIWRKPTSKRIRILLQWWGTEYRRETNQNYWLDFLTESLSEDTRYVITDVRFPNEAELVRSLGGEVWKIIGRESPNLGITNHPSEGIDLIKADRTIPNAGTLEQLAEFIDVLLH